MHLHKEHEKDQSRSSPPFSVLLHMMGFVKYERVDSLSHLTLRITVVPRFSSSIISTLITRTQQGGLRGVIYRLPDLRGLIGN